MVVVDSMESALPHFLVGADLTRDLNTPGFTAQNGPKSKNLSKKLKVDQ